MFKNKESKLNKSESLDDLDLDFGDNLDFNFDLDEDDTRSAVTKAKAGFKKAFNPKTEGLNFTKTLAFAALPKSYSYAGNEVAQISNDISAMYSDTKRELEPALNVARKLGKKALIAIDPIADKYLPKKISERIKKAAKEANENSSNNYEQKNVNPQDVEIAATLSSIFNHQRSSNNLSLQTTIANTSIDRELGKKQFSYSAGIQANMANNLAKLVGYQDNVLDQYYKKSLELQHRQYFSTRELLEQSKAASINVLAELKAITKNTGLPDEVKIRDSEIFKNRAKHLIIGKIQDYGRSGLGRITRNVRENLNRATKDFVSTVTGANDMMGMSEGLGDSTEMAGEMAGTLTRDYLGVKLGKAFKTGLPKLGNRISPTLLGPDGKITNKIKKGAAYADNFSNNWQNKIISKTRDADGQGVWGIIGDLIGNTSNHDTITKNLQKDANESVPWDLISRRTLIEIIPGFLSRSLEKLSDVYNVLTGNNEKAGRTVYSTTREKFVSHKTAISDAHITFKNRINPYIKNEVNEIINYIDDASNPLTGADKLELSLFLANESMDNINFDPTRYADKSKLPNSWSSELRSKISNLFINAFNITEHYKPANALQEAKTTFKMGNSLRDVENHARLSTHFKNTGLGIYNSSDIYGEYHKVGSKDLLHSLGALNNEGNVDPEYKQRLLRELLNDESIASDVFKPKNDENRIRRELKNHRRRIFNPNYEDQKYNNNFKYSNLDSEVPDEIIPGNTDRANRVRSKTKPSMSTSAVTSTNIDLDYDKLAEVISNNSNNTIIEAIDKLIENNNNVAGINIAMLERLVSGIENIEYVHTGGNISGLTSSVKKKNWGSLLSGPKALGGFAKNIFKAEMGLRKIFKPVRAGMRGAIKGAFGIGSTIGKGALDLGVNAGLGLSKLVGRTALSTAKKLPGRLGNYANAVNWFGSNVAMPIGSAGVGLTTDAAIGASKLVGNAALHTAKQMPGRLSTYGSVLGKGIGGVHNLLKYGYHGKPSDDHTAEDYIKSESLFHKLKSSINENETVKDLFVKGETSARLKATLIEAGEYIDVKTNKVITSVKDITGPVIDKAKNIVLDENDIHKGLFIRVADGIKKLKINIKSINKDNIKNKFTFFKKPKFLMGTDTGIAFTLVDKVTNAIVKKDTGIENSINKLTEYMKKAMPTKDGEEQEATRSGGWKDIMKKRTEAAKAKAEGVKSSVSNKASDKVTKAKALGGSLLDSAKNLGGKILSKVGGWLGIGAETAAVTGGSLLAGVSTTLAPITLGGYGISKFKDNLMRKLFRQFSGLGEFEKLRLLQYGVPLDNNDAVKNVRYLEQTLADKISVGPGGVKVNIDEDEVWSEFGPEFGNKIDDPDDRIRFFKWLRNRFLPVYVKHLVVAKNFKVGGKSIGFDKLSNEQKIKYLSAISFGATELKLGLNPISVMVSPWKNISLANNSKLIDIQIDNIRNTAAKNIKKANDNKSQIKPIPIAKPKEKTAKELADSYEKARAENVANLAKKDEEKSTLDKVIDWAKVNIVDKVKNFAGNAIDKAKDFGNKALDAGVKVWDATKSGVKTASKWANTNIIQPIANSLAGLIQKAESGNKGYNAYNRGTMGNKILGPLEPRDLTKMTIAEILSDMTRPASDPKRLFAVGKYQMIPSTMKDGIAKLGIDPTTTLYDAATQERLFSGYLLDKKRKNISAFIKGKSDNITAAMNDAASEWASIADPRTGASKYGNGNKASVSVDQLAGALNKSKELYAHFITQGKSEEEAYQMATSVDNSGSKPTQLAAATAAPTNTVVPGSSTPSTNSSNGIVPGSTVAGNALPATPNSIAAINTDSNKTPSAASGDIDNLMMSSANSTPSVNVDMPDMSHISKATYAVGDDAAKQRQAQIDAQSKTNDLLAQLLNKTDTANNTGGNTTVVNANPQPASKPITPIVDLNRKS